MSKVKSPQEKKRKSLLKDRRNVYGECPTSSRKNIRRGKQRSHMGLRRAVAEELRSMKGASAELDGDIVEARAKVRVVEHVRTSFRKVPDAPLAVVLDRKSTQRKEGQGLQTESFASDAEWMRAEQRMLREIRRK